MTLCVLLFQAVSGDVERWAVSLLPLTDETQGHNEQSFPVTVQVLVYAFVTFFSIWYMDICKSCRCAVLLKGKSTDFRHEAQFTTSWEL